MDLILHQTHLTVADFKAPLQILKDKFSDQSVSGLHAFPELFLTGYPLQDLCLNKSFIKSYQKLIKDINTWSISLPKKNDLLILVGGLKYNLDDSDNIESIENVIYSLSPGEELQDIYSKVLLPNYDIFDEKKYFTPGEKSKVLDFQNKKIGVLVCEDMWPSSTHHINPVENLKKTCGELDLVVNLSASPFDLAKNEKRIQRAKEITKFLGCPFAYINRVGGEDEILFDGGSFIVSGDDFVQAKFFEADQLNFKISKNELSTDSVMNEEVPSTWEGLFDPALEFMAGKLPKLKDLKSDSFDLLINALSFGLQEYARKSGFNKFLVALSGGMDSALVLTIAKLALKPGQSIEAVYMPSEYSRDISESLSKELCTNLNIPLKILPIQDLHNQVRTDFESHIGESLDGLADENIQSRIRGGLIYARSNQTGAMVINTSNKSELAVGYSTLYGDSVGAISLLGDLFKSEVFALAEYINTIHNNLIPRDIITRPPSAELRSDQEDTDSLPAYERLDAILEGLLSYRLTLSDLVSFGFNHDEVERVFNLYRRTEFKRAQFCPIIKVKAKSFGFGYRVPLTKNIDFYMKDETLL